MIDFKKLPICLQNQPKHSPAYLVGGAVRSLYHAEEPRDWDVCLDDCSCLLSLSHAFVMFLTGCFPSPIMTRLGGWKFKVGDKALDVWQVSESFHLKQVSRPNRSLLLMLQHAPFTVDQVAVGLGNGKVVFGEHAEQDIHNRRFGLGEFTELLSPRNFIRGYRLVCNGWTPNKQVKNCMRQSLIRFGWTRLVSSGLSREELGDLSAIYPDQVISSINSTSGLTRPRITRP